MKFEFDEANDATNLEKHELSLSQAADFEILRFEEDNRADYGERRFRAWGTIDGRFHTMAFTLRGTVVRVIMLRRARDKEIRRYVPKDRLR